MKYRYVGERTRSVLGPTLDIDSPPVTPPAPHMLHSDSRAGERASYEVLFGTSRAFSPRAIINDSNESCSSGPLTVRNSILGHDHPGHRWVQPGCFHTAGICSQGIRGCLSLASSPSPRCIVLRGADEAGLTFSWRILSSASLSEKCSTLVSCRSISVSHTRMLSLVPSNSSLWLVKCCQRGGLSRLF